RLVVLLTFTPPEYTGKPISCIAFVSLTEPSVTSPEHPFSLAIVLNTPPNIPPASKYSPLDIINTSPGWMSCNALCKIRLSPGFALTVKADPQNLDSDKIGLIL